MSTNLSVSTIQPGGNTFGSPTAVPEPSTILLLATGLAGMAAYRRQRAA